MPVITPLIQARGLERTFSVPGKFLGPRRRFYAVSGVQLHVDRGETLAVVGESGSGKTTLARMLLGLLEPSAGEILLDGTPMRSLGRQAIARRVQPIFQDPYSSLNPRKSIESIISLPLRVHGIGDAASQRRATSEMMDRVGLPSRLAGATPNQLSGGQRQRVAIARALVMGPELVICDEPTSALDVSVQSQILNLLQDLQKDLGLTYILITHNLAVVQHMAARVAVMYLGRIVEQSPTPVVFNEPLHPYTRALMESVLTPDPDLGLPEDRLGVTFPNSIEPPMGCHFHPRCELRVEACTRTAPPMVTTGPSTVECHLYASRPPARNAQSNTRRSNS